MPDPLTVVVTIPGLKVESETNNREHHMKRYRRSKTQKELTRAYLALLGRGVRDRLRASPRVVVRFTRLGGRQWDSDNVTIAFKHVRDAVADFLQRDDRPGSGVEWVLPPGQEPGEVGVRIELEAEGVAE